MIPPKFRSHMTVDLIDHMGSDDRIAFMARGSTNGGDSTHERNVKLVNKLLIEKHKKPLEHCIMSFRLEMPMFTARQFDTYRHQSRSELSGRYTEMPGVFYIPTADRPLGQSGSRMAYDMVELDEMDHADAVIGMQSNAMACWREYEALLRLGVSREMARIVLPASIYTEIRTTMNLLAAFNIVSQRIDWGEAAVDPTHPQFEIEQVARGMWKHMQDLFPAACEGFAERGYTI